MKRTPEQDRVEKLIKRLSHEQAEIDKNLAVLRENLKKVQNRLEAIRMTSVRDPDSSLLLKESELGQEIKNLNEKKIRLQEEINREMIKFAGTIKPEAPSAGTGKSDKTAEPAQRIQDDSRNIFMTNIARKRENLDKARNDLKITRERYEKNIRSREENILKLEEEIRTSKGTHLAQKQKALDDARSDLKEFRGKFAAAGYAGKVASREQNIRRLQMEIGILEHNQDIIQKLVDLCSAFNLAHQKSAKPISRFFQRSRAGDDLIRGFEGFNTVCELLDTKSQQALGVSLEKNGAFLKMREYFFQTMPERFKKEVHNKEGGIILTRSLEMLGLMGKPTLEATRAVTPKATREPPTTIRPKRLT